MMWKDGFLPTLNLVGNLGGAESCRVAAPVQRGEARAAGLRADVRGQVRLHLQTVRRVAPRALRLRRLERAHAHGSVRPLLDMDVKKENIVSVLDQKVIVVTDPGHQSDFKPGTNYLTSGKTKEKRYVYTATGRGIRRVYTT